MSKQETLRPDQIADRIAPAMSGYKFIVALNHWYKGADSPGWKPAAGVDTVIMGELMNLREQGIIPTRDLVSEVDHALRALLADNVTNQ